MKLHKTLIIMFLLFTSGSLFLNSQATSTSPGNITPDLTTTKLLVATRHEFSLYTTMAAAFAASPLGQSVGITSGSDIQFETPTTFEGFVNVMKNTNIRGDVAWGGGPTLFNNLAAEGALAPITDTLLLADIAANITDVIAGAEMKKFADNGDLTWVASAISSFGFTVNHLELEKRGLPTPANWTDLASPEFFTSISEFNLGIGNAPDTSSNTRIYQIILQNFGWEAGWELIYNMAGNAKIYTSSGDTRDSVLGAGGSDPETATSLTIDFYGLRVMNENPNTELIIPGDGTIVNGDPIAFGGNAEPTHDAAAKAFVRFVVSQEGQSVLLDEAINRLPVRFDAFRTPFGLTKTNIELFYNETINGESILFDEDLALSLEETMRYYFAATIFDVRDKLRTAWAKLAGAFNQGAFPKERFDQINLVFGAPLITIAEAQAIEPDIGNDAIRLAKQAEWSSAANAKYDLVIDMVNEPYTFTTTEIITEESTTITNIITSSDTASSIEDTVTDVPVSGVWQIFGIFVLMTIKLVRTRKK